MVEFRVLGSVDVLDDGRVVSVGGARQRRLLAMLLIHRNAAVSVDRLAEAVFAGEPTAAAATTLRSYVARIRKVIDGDPRVSVTAQAPGYRLQVIDAAVDAAAFEQLVDEAGRAADRGDPVEASRCAQEALTMWRGDPFPEFDDEPWVQPEAQRLRELRLVAHERWFDAELASGRAAGIIPRIEVLVAEEPLREGFRAQLMLALYRAGRHADALRSYQEHRQYLLDEMGLDPSPELAGLERRILDHDPSLAVGELPGHRMRGYRLGERLGSGEDGALFAARMPGLERDLVVRVVRTDLADEPVFVRDFERRCRAVAALRHPAIVPIVDQWREPHGAYVVTRRLFGGSLADRLARGRLDETAIGDLVDRIGGALHAAHSVGIAHGRVHADNVVFDEFGEPCLTDFALCPPVDDDARQLVALVFAASAAPSRALRDLADEVASGGGPADVAGVVEALRQACAAPDAVVRNPYKGLDAFDEADAVDFFGRQQIVDELLTRLGGDGVSSRLMVLVGGSGSGKSSVVRAGLLPAVRAGAVAGSAEWLITTMLPGADPFVELVEALRQVSTASPTTPGALAASPERLLAEVRTIVGGTGRLLLVVDQFEELFTLADEVEQQRFLDAVRLAVLEPDSPLIVVFTLRADFFDRPLAVPGFGELMNAAAVSLAAMAPAQLEASIVEPARRVGRTVDGALVAELVAAVSRDSSALPALQFTMYQLAEGTDGAITLGDYRRIGGLSGAVAARAEQLYCSMSPFEQATVRRLFEQMVIVTDGEPTRRRPSRAELTGGEAMTSALIDRWAAARLLTTDRDQGSRLPTVELAHEALLWEWPRLTEWIDEDRGDLVVLGSLRHAAGAWIDDGRDVDGLLRGARLAAAVDVAGRRPADVSGDERELLAASVAEQERRDAEQGERLAQQVRTNRRLRWQLAAVAVSLVVALVGGLLAVRQQRVAEGERRSATARQLAAAADANRPIDPERSTLLALAAVDEGGGDEGGPLPEAVQSLHAALAANRLLVRADGIGGVVDSSPDGSFMVTEGPEQSGMVDLRDATTGESVRTWRADDVDLNDVAFSADSTMLGTAGDDGGLRVWDPRTGALLFEYESAPGLVAGVSFSGDGHVVAASWIGERTVRIFDLRTGELMSERDELPLIVVTSLNTDGSRVVVADAGEPVAYVADTATSEVQLTLSAPDTMFLRLARFSPDGRRIATAGSDGAVRVWDAATGELLAVGAGHDGGTQALDWSADGRRLASGSDDGTARVWDVGERTLRSMVTVSAQDTRNGVYGVALSADGQRLWTGDYGVTSALLWDVSVIGPAELSSFTVGDTWASPLAALPGGVVLHGTDDGGLALRGVRTGEVRELESDGAADPVQHLAVDDEARVAVSAAEFAPIAVWDLEAGRQLAELGGDIVPEFVLSVDISGDGSAIAVAWGGDDASGVVVMDRQGRQLARFDEEPGVWVRGALFSPDGTLLSIPRRPARDDDLARQGVWLWDWRADETVGKIETWAAGAAWSGDGARLATWGQVESVIEVWDVQSAERLRAISGRAPFAQVVFMPDDADVVATGLDGTVSVWDLSSGRSTLTLDGSGTTALSVAVGEDWLATVDSRHIARAVTLDTTELEALARARLTRGLSAQECVQYFRRDVCAA